MRPREKARQQLASRRPLKERRTTSGCHHGLAAGKSSTRRIEGACGEPDILQCIAGKLSSAKIESVHEQSILRRVRPEYRDAGTGSSDTGELRQQRRDVGGIREKLPRIGRIK